MRIQDQPYEHVFLYDLKERIIENAKFYGGHGAGEFAKRWWEGYAEERMADSPYGEGVVSLAAEIIGHMVGEDFQKTKAQHKRAKSLVDA